MVLGELRGLTQIVHVYLKCHVLALSHTVWSRQYEETENQFPRGLVQIRQLLEGKRSVNLSEAEQDLGASFPRGRV